MALRPTMSPWEKLNFVRRIPSTQVLTPAEKGMYTGIFSSQGYDYKNAYNYYEREVYDGRSGYLRGLGGDNSLWGGPRARGLGEVPDPCAGMSFFQKYLSPDCDLARLRARNPDSRSAFADECEGFTDLQCQAMRMAAGLPPGSEVELNRTATSAPTSSKEWASTVKWVAIAGAFGVGAYALYSIFGKGRK